MVSCNPGSHWYTEPLIMRNDTLLIHGAPVTYADTYSAPFLLLSAEHLVSKYISPDMTVVDQ